MQTSAFKFLPFLLATLVVVGAVAFASQKFVSPTPFVTVKPFRGDSVAAIPTPTPTPTLIPQTNDVSPGTVAQANRLNAVPIPKSARRDSSQVKPSLKTETVCTPVYGMANSCAEHAVVDTGLETGAFYNLAALSYFGGLAAFIKAKRA